MLRGMIDYASLIWHRNHFSAAQLRRYQERQLLKLTDFAVRNSQFYRDSYSDIRVRSMQDFKNLPIINKQIMMDKFDELNTCGLRLEDVRSYALEKEKNKDYSGYYKDLFVIGLSSGTSGNKGIFVTPKELTSRLPAVFLARSGIPLRLLPFRILFLLRVFSQGFADIRSPLVSLTYLSTMEPINKIADSIREKGINVLMAPPSLIRLLLPLSGELKAYVRMIVTYAEVLEEEEKQRFKEAFGTEVVEIYQASEGQIGSPCRCGSLHINEDLVLVELFDENGNEVEKPGDVATRMLVTNLVNYAQPLIRYEMNDLVVLGDPCPCGSSFRVIRKVLGRFDDVIFLRNSRRELQHVFPDLMSRWIITSSDNIREFQVVQKGDSSLEIILDLFDMGGDAQRMLEDLLKRRFSEELAEFGIEAEISVRFEAIPLPEIMAKYKRFWADKSIRGASG